MYFRMAEWVKAGAVLPFIAEMIPDATLPARWLKTQSSVIHLSNTVVKSPGVFTGVPDDWSTR